MHDLSGDWVGNISGTNNGDVFAEIEQKDNSVSGTARIHDRLLGITVYRFTGIIEGEQILLNLVPETRQKVAAVNVIVQGRPVTVQAPTVVSGDVNVVATINNSTISGKWTSSLGTGGLFTISKSNIDAKAVDVANDQKEQVFVMMPIAADKPELEDILGAVKRSAKKYGVSCLRVDEIEHTGKITDLILNQINCSRYLVCDISIERPNVYYELGYSHGRGKEVILIAREGSTIHFDIKDYNIIFYKNITELEERLSKRIEALSELRDIL
jgi:hypothetical protein